VRTQRQALRQLSEILHHVTNPGDVAQRAGRLEDFDEVTAELLDHSDFFPANRPNRDTAAPSARSPRQGLEIAQPKSRRQSRGALQAETFLKVTEFTPAFGAESHQEREEPAAIFVRGEACANQAVRAGLRQQPVNRTFGSEENDKVLGFANRVVESPAVQVFHRELYFGDWKRRR